MKTETNKLFVKLGHRFARKPVSDWSDGAVLLLFSAASIQVAYWGGAFLAKFLVPAIELTNALGFTWGTFVIGVIMLAVGANVALCTLVATFTGGVLTNRLFRPISTMP